LQRRIAGQGSVEFSLQVSDVGVTKLLRPNLPSLAVTIDDQVSVSGLVRRAKELAAAFVNEHIEEPPLLSV